MDRLIYTAMSGANAAMQRQSVLASNLANGPSTRVFALETTAGYADTPGLAQSTGNPLDAMAKGGAWFAVQGLDGVEAYTRAGAMHVNAEGALVNAQGLPMLDDSGAPLNMAAHAEPSIGTDGTTGVLEGSNVNAVEAMPWGALAALLVVAGVQPAASSRLAIAPMAAPSGALLLASAVTPLLCQAQPTRIKEIASVQGVRSNHLTGYGIVIGLDGTGDQTAQMPYTSQSISNYLKQQGIGLPSGGGPAPQLRNIASVIVTGKLPAFAEPGQLVDVVVSSIGNAKSLKGGTLITTPLKGADGEIYALAQGNVIVGGAGASQAGSRVQVNQLSVGRVVDGAQIERSVTTSLLQGPFIQLALNSSDFQTARKVTDAINTHFGTGTARALSGRSVQVDAPTDANERVSFLADLEEIKFEASLPAAMVVINARTGSIVFNQSVTLGPCAIAHGNLTITVSATPVISQPGALSSGSTVVKEKANIQMREGEGRLMYIAAAPKLEDVVRAINLMGATTQDLLHILEAMKAAGALLAELVRSPSLAFDVKALGTLKLEAKRKDPAAIAQAAKEFESLFMRELIKSMRQATMRSGLLDSQAGDVSADLLDQQLAQAMSGRPGGLSEIIARQLSKQIVARFRAYDSYADSFKDYAKLITGSARYAQAAGNMHNAQTYATHLQQAGYATDPQYAHKLSRAIAMSMRTQNIKGKAT
eukprot:gene1030-1010_t